MQRLDCSADLAIWLLSDPLASLWGRLHSLKVVSAETGQFVGNWPMIDAQAPTPERGILRARRRA